jgi:hypothetical protein
VVALEKDVVAGQAARVDHVAAVRADDVAHGDVGAVLDVEERRPAAGHVEVLEFDPGAVRKLKKAKCFISGSMESCGTPPRPPFRDVLAPRPRMVMGACGVP